MRPKCGCSFSPLPLDYGGGCPSVPSRYFHAADTFTHGRHERRFLPAARDQRKPLHQIGPDRGGQREAFTITKTEVDTGHQTPFTTMSNSDHQNPQGVGSLRSLLAFKEGMRWDEAWSLAPRESEPKKTKNHTGLRFCLFQRVFAETLQNGTPATTFKLAICKPTSKGVIALFRSVGAPSRPPERLLVAAMAVSARQAAPSVPSPNSATLARSAQPDQVGGKWRG